MKGFTVAVVAIATLAAAPSAQAALTVQPSTTQAGANADLTVRMTFASSPKSLVLHLPPGLVGNPNAVAKCPIATFEAGGCPAASRVGTTTATALGLPLGGTVYNLAPRPDEPARLGIDIPVLLSNVRNQASISLRPDGGLDSTIATLESPLDISALELTLNRTFMTLPTSCAPATVSVDTPENGTDSGSFTPTGCDQVPFAPSVSATLETTQRVVPSGATVGLGLPAGHAHVKRAEIVLPVGTTMSPGVADGLVACTDDQLAATQCPDASQIGTVAFDTPVLGTLGGRVYFALGSPYRLFVVIQERGVLVKLTGDVRLDPATGQITTIFDNLPQVPFTAFALSFKGGADAVLANPAGCGTKTVTATVTPWSGTPAKIAEGSFTIDADGRGGACAQPALAPGLSVAAASTAAGRPAGAVTLAISRPDGSEDMARVTAQLPPGLAGSLKGIPVCPDAAADVGACPEATRVGTVSAQAGSGAAPVALAGSVSLTGPTDGGFAGLAMAIPGRVGPVDLGTVVVRASIALRADGGLTVRTSKLPALLGGVPVSIRQFALTLDRPGFILNASSCAPKEVAAVVEGASGSTATVTAPYQASDCAGLRFAPRLEATVGKRGQTRGFAPLRAVITVPAGQAATAVAQVDLPSTLSIDLSRISKACAPAAFVASSCPPSARIGTAVATTPLLDAPLTSAVTLASREAGQLPGLALNLTGPVSLPLFGTIPISAARIRNTFDGIPDLPLERFELVFTGGASSPLRLARDACTGARQRVQGTFTAHSGTVAKVSAPLRVAGCPPVVALKRRGHRLTVRITRGRDAAAIRSATIKPPGAKQRKVKARQTLRLAKLPGKRSFTVKVKDRAGQSWTIRARAK